MVVGSSSLFFFVGDSSFHEVLDQAGVSSPAKFAYAISRPSLRIDQSPCFCPRLVHGFGLQGCSARSNLNAALLDVEIRQCEARNQQGSILGHSWTREFASSAGKGQSMTRDWLIKLWDEEKRKGNLRKIANSVKERKPTKCSTFSQLEQFL